MTPRPRRLWAVTAVAFAARALVVLWAAPRFPPAGDGHYYDILARRLASGQGYTWGWPDGAVTYAAHYPVGYPAILAAVYSTVGASLGAAMLLHAILGAACAYATYRVVDGPGVAPWRPTGAALAVALHPALVAYTAALMTEGVTASLLMVAAACAAAARRAAGDRRRSWVWLSAAGVAMACATFVRPQSLAFAPVLGAAAPPAGAGARARVRGGAWVVAVALLCVAPWTARNCVRMHRCALVSVNEGWNLLIGTSTDTGGWQEVKVPPECATVWDEAGKDRCFDHAARRAIAAAPLAWLARAPSKLAMTFDYVGGAPWYLHESNPASFGEGAKIALASAETLAARFLLLGALVAAGRLGGPRLVARKVAALMGAIAALTPQGWIAYGVLLVVLALAGARAWVRAPIAVPAGAAAVALTVLVHAVFFGAGRYGLVIAPFVAGLAFADAGAIRGGVDAARAVVRDSSPRGPREESPSSTEHDAG